MKAELDPADQLVLERLQQFASSEADPENSAELRARTLELAKSQPSLSRPALRTRRWLVLAASVLIPFAVFLYWGGLRSGPRPSELIVETALGAALIALVACVAAFGRGGSMLGRSRGALLAVVILTPLALLVWKLGISSAHPGMVDEWTARPGFRCLHLSCLLSIVPLIGSLVFLRRSDPVHPMLLGMAMGAAVSGSSWVLVDMWCPIAYLPHLLLGHVLPLLLAVGVGAALGRWMLAPKRA